MSKSSHSDFQRKLVIRRMARGAKLRSIQGNRFRLGKNTVIEEWVVDAMLASGELVTGGKGYYFLGDVNIGESDANR